MKQLYIPSSHAKQTMEESGKSLMFYAKKGSPWNISEEIHLEPLGIKLVVVYNCTTCFTLLSQEILITYFLRGFLSLPLQNLT